MTQVAAERWEDKPVWKQWEELDRRLTTAGKIDPLYVFRRPSDLFNEYTMLAHYQYAYRDDGTCVINWEKWLYSRPVGSQVPFAYVGQNRGVEEVPPQPRGA